MVAIELYNNKHSIRRRFPVLHSHDTCEKNHIIDAIAA
jgi:hypothetical protein